MTGPTELDERWAIVRGQPLFYRTATPEGSSQVILHLHGFAISGSYMVPTARALSDEFSTYVPDLPGFGRSVRPDHALTIPELADTAAAFLDEMGVDRATVLGNSLGCPVLGSFATRHPDRIERAIMVSPAGGKHSQPLLRAVTQLALDAPREPLSMATVAVPDYIHFGILDALRLFIDMTRFPSFETLHGLNVPLLVVLGTRDPLLPSARWIRTIADGLPSETTVAVIKGAAHAINYSHPRELSAIVRQYLRDEPVIGLPSDPDAAPVGLIRSH